MQGERQRTPTTILLENQQSLAVEPGGLGRGRTYSGRGPHLKREALRGTLDDIKEKTKFVIISKKKNV